jgi:hypothetical protein
VRQPTGSVASAASRRLAGPNNQGWLQAFAKLDATLLHAQSVATDVEV